MLGFFQYPNIFLDIVFFHFNIFTSSNLFKNSFWFIIHLFNKVTILFFLEIIEVLLFFCFQFYLLACFVLQKFSDIIMNKIEVSFVYLNFTFFFVCGVLNIFVEHFQRLMTDIFLHKIPIINS